MTSKAIYTLRKAAAGRSHLARVGVVIDDLPLAEPEHGKLPPVPDSWVMAAYSGAYVLAAFQQADEGVPEYDPDRQTWFIRFTDGHTLLPPSS